MIEWQLHTMSRPAKAARAKWEESDLEQRMDNSTRKDEEEQRTQDSTHRRNHLYSRELKANYWSSGIPISLR